MNDHMIKSFALSVGATELKHQGLGNPFANLDQDWEDQFCLRTNTIGIIALPIGEVLDSCTCIRLKV